MFRWRLLIHYNEVIVVWNWNESAVLNRMYIGCHYHCNCTANGYFHVTQSNTVIIHRLCQTIHCDMQLCVQKLFSNNILLDNTPYWCRLFVVQRCHSKDNAHILLLLISEMVVHAYWSTPSSSFHAMAAWGTYHINLQVPIPYMHHRSLQMS